MYNKGRVKLMKKTETKQKAPLWKKLLLFPLKLILAILAVILIWFTFCFFDRIKPVDAIPPEYALYLRTDKVWDNAEPLLDLDASLIALTSPELQKFRQTFLNLKSSKLRNNFFVKHALKRRLDAAIYQPDANDKNTFTIVLDAGFLSGAVRLFPFILPHIKKLSDKIELCSNNFGKFYKFKDAGFFVIKKNLVIFASSREQMYSSMRLDNISLYKAEELAAMNARLDEPMRILADSSNLIKIISSTNEESTIQYYIDAVLPFLSQEKYASLNLGITNSDLNLSIDIPFELPQDIAEQPVLQLLKKESSVPSLLPKFSDEIQYYTLLNAGSLSELKKAAMKILPQEKGLDSAWANGDSVCKILFNKSLDEILFSWTADEFAFLGIEGKSEPVLCIKISNEEKRQEIFSEIFSSFIIQANDSLLVDGVRLPCIQIPSFISGILQALDVNVPRPYYLVKDDFIYFSQSPENLISINSFSKNDTKLSSSENWKRVSSKLSPDSTISLFYNLERSVPFFIKGSSTFSKILSLYNSGRFDIKIKAENLSIQLQASTAKPEASNTIPGFPIVLQNKVASNLINSNNKKSNLIFWIEEDSTVNSMNCTTFKQNKSLINELAYIMAAEEETSEACKGELWAVTKSGLVYLLDKELNPLEGYPLLTGLSDFSEPFIYEGSLCLMNTNGKLIKISHDCKITEIQINTESSIKAAPSVSENIIAFYEKGFFGGIHVLESLEEITADGPLELDGIAYGSPCVFKVNGKSFIAMITQAGSLYLFDSDFSLLPDFPIELDGVFYINVKASDNYIFAISSEGSLYRVDLQGNCLQVKIPYFSANKGLLTIQNYDDSGNSEIFISGEGNSLYGFNTELELLPAFPLAGYGIPIFKDLNGDNKKDCLILTLDNTISATNVLRQ